MAKKLKVMFSTHGLVEGDFGFELDEKGYPTSKVISKKLLPDRIPADRFITLRLWLPTPITMMSIW